MISIIMYFKWTILQFREQIYRINSKKSVQIFLLKHLAILKAIETIVDMKPANFITLSDSLSAISSIKNKTNPSDITSYKTGSMKLKLKKRFNFPN